MTKYLVTIGPVEISIDAISPHLPPEPLPVSLRTLAQHLGIDIGMMAIYYRLERDVVYTNTLQQQATIVTVANGIFFDNVHPLENTYDFAGSAKTIAFAEANGMTVRGHTLVWHDHLPDWVTEKVWTKSSLESMLQDHIATVVGQYRGRVHCWDVVNESIAYDGSGFIPSLWRDIIGPEFIDLAFQWAHEADPDALLFLNEHGLFTNATGKVDAVCELVEGMQARDVPFHGVGIQMHLEYAKGQPSPVNPVELRAILQRFEDLGLLVQITEMDVRIKDPAHVEDLAAQAQIYKEIVQVCAEAPNCTAVVTWGLGDNDSWVPWAYPGWNSALIFGKDWIPKPAYYALLEMEEDIIMGRSLLSLPGVNENSASTPHAASLNLSTTGDLQVIWLGIPVDYTPVGSEALYGKGFFNDCSHLAWIRPNGFLWSQWMAVDETVVSRFSTASLPVGSNGIKIVVIPDNGAGSWEIYFYSSNDWGDTWAQLGATVSEVGALDIRDTVDNLYVGTHSAGGDALAGTMRRFQLYDGSTDHGSASQTLRFDSNFAAEAPGTTSFAESSVNAATVTINQSGSPQAEIIIDPITARAASHHYQHNMRT